MRSAELAIISPLMTRWKEEGKERKEASWRNSCFLMILGHLSNASSMVLPDLGFTLRLFSYFPTLGPHFIIGLIFTVT